ncbi:hypothetical protein [Oscillibacter sp.]|uniref:hypothetical protein n=1 Tax=Oscillibacter sp. TaxID=1945593 RepID=UPI001B61C724|nr:hypothetical protein [Oscillibacter sp.]MBP3509426.1 hypothetical protein [Oscillibacter sp.]
MGELFKDYSLAATIVIGLSAATTCYLQIRILRYFLKDTCCNWKITVYGFALSFIWPWNFLGYDISTLYLLSGATAPVHNATYLFAKPFALICFFLYYLLIDSLPGQTPCPKATARNQNRMLVMFSILFLLSVLAKPNFYQIFAPAGALIAVICWLYYGNRVFLFCCKLAMAFVPATAWVLMNMDGTISLRYSPLEGYHIYNSTSILLAIAQSLLFVIFVAVSGYVFRKNGSMLLIGITVWIVGALEFFLWVQNGEEGSLNLMWGYLCAQYLLFCIAVICFEKMKPLFKGNLYYFGQFLFFGHFVMGVYAFASYSCTNWSLLLAQI